MTKNKDPKTESLAEIAVDLMFGQRIGSRD